MSSPEPLREVLESGPARIRPVRREWFAGAPKEAAAGPSG
jgi:hypothetical protein